MRIRFRQEFWNEPYFFKTGSPWARCGCPGSTDRKGPAGSQPTKIFSASLNSSRGWGCGRPLDGGNGRRAGGVLAFSGAGPGMGSAFLADVPSGLVGPWAGIWRTGPGLGYPGGAERPGFKALEPVAVMFVAGPSDRLFHAQQKARLNGRALFGWILGALGGGHGLGPGNAQHHV